MNFRMGTFHNDNTYKVVLVGVEERWAHELNDVVAALKNR